MLLRLSRIGGITAGLGRRRLGVTARLQLAFLAVFLLAALTGAAGLYVFSTLEGAIRTLGHQTVPSTLRLLEARRQLDQLTALAPALAAAGRTERVDEVTKTYESSRSAFDRTLASLPPDERPLFEEAAVSLDNLFHELASRKRMHISAREQLSAELTALHNRHEGIRDILEGPIDSLEFEFLLSLEGLNSGSGDLADSTYGAEGSAEGLSLVDRYDRLRALVALSGGLERMRNLLDAIAAVEDPALIGPLEERLQAEEADVRKSLENLSQDILARVRENVEALLAASTGENGIPAYRRKLLADDLALRAQAERAAELARAVAQQVEERVHAARRDLDGTIAASTGEARRGLWMLVGAVAVTLGVAGSLGWFYVRRSLARRLDALHAATVAVAQGELDVEIPASGHDELAEMGRALATFRDRTAEARALEEERRAAEARAEEEKRRARLELASRLEREVGELADAFATMAAELGEHARALSRRGEDDAAGRIDEVATACRELEKASRQIAEEMERARGIGETAAEGSERSVTMMRELDATIREIDEVVTLIADIAERTHLLALNATIEAVRAGEAGRGFAVVASEVKSLAEQTSKATETITERIRAIRETSNRTVAAADTMRAIVGDLRQVSSTVAAAVEEQLVTIQNIAISAEGAADAADSVRSFARTVSERAGELRDRVRRVVEALRAA